jgi:hypothetical protein
VRRPIPARSDAPACPSDPQAARTPKASAPWRGASASWRWGPTRWRASEASCCSPRFPRSPPCVPGVTAPRLAGCAFERLGNVVGHHLSGRLLGHLIKERARSGESDTSSRTSPATSPRPTWRSAFRQTGTAGTDPRTALPGGTKPWHEQAATANRGGAQKALSSRIARAARAGFTLRGHG